MTVAKPEKQASEGIVIGDSIVPWSFVWQSFAKCGRDWDTTIDAFWKARRAIGKNAIQRYMLYGFRHPTKFMLRPSKEREEGKMQNLREWWLSLYERKRSSSKECSDIVASLMQAFSIGDIGANTSRTPV